MQKSVEKRIKRERRHGRIRAKAAGTAKKPRLSVYKSNRNLSAQLIDDEKGATIVSVHSNDSKAETPMERAKDIGGEIAKRAKAKKVTTVVFDRGGYMYTGNIKEFAEGARKGGLKF